MSIIYEKKGRIAYLTINRPNSLNACDWPTYYELSRAWVDFRNDPNVWVAILTGAGDRAFCAGSDIKLNFNVTQSTADPFGTTTTDEPEERPDIVRGLELWKPTIAAINGHANGGGLEMALACDIRIASENAQFGLGEVRIGLLPGGGGTQRLPRAIPLGIAMEMLFTGRRIDAQEAYRVGLVNRVVPLPDLLPAATALAEEICEYSAPLSVRAIKQASMRGKEMSLDDGLRLEAHMMQFLRQTEDSREGTRAFAEKRKPAWKAR